MLAAAHSPQPHTLQAQRGRDQWHDRHHVHLMFSLADDGASSLACMIARYDLKLMHSAYCGCARASNIIYKDEFWSTRRAVMVQLVWTFQHPVTRSDIYSTRLSAYILS